MSKALDKVGSTVFDAASSPLRMQMLRLLTSKGPLPYTEIMFSLKLDPLRDAGKFVYHLRNLQEAGLIVFDKEAKKYSLTELGSIVVDFSRDIDEYVTVKRGKLFVRTSRLAIEEFDRGKIARSLVVEAGVPYEQAEEIAAEAEERLIRLKTAYLTAPLIREFVNAILIEKKLEDYRHKLTRLGMPVYDVTQSLKTASVQMLDAESVKRAAGASVMEEYVLLNCLPREIADAHMSGQLHLDNLGEWILKPSEFQHDMRYFLRKGLHAGPPKNFASALALVRDVYLLTSSEVSSEQSFDMFNVFLAPYAKGEPESRITENLESFINSARIGAYGGTGKPGLSLGCEFTVPTFLREVEAIGPQGKAAGKYKDFIDEARALLNSTIDVLNRLSAGSPVTNPRFIFKIRGDSAQPEQFRRELLVIQHLASDYFLPYFAFLASEAKSDYTATGLRLNDDWTGFWETDSQRTGCMDTIFVNLPRIAYEARNNDDRFVDLLRKALDLAVKAFRIKRECITERIRESLLPTLSGAGATDSYIHSESSLYAISPIGLNEAVTAHTGLTLGNREGNAGNFALKILKEISSYAKVAAEESNMRYTLAHRPGDEAAVRLAELDVEEYGVGSTVVQGMRKYPYYTDLVGVPPTEKVSLDDRLAIEAKLQSPAGGGHLLPINLIPSKLDQESFVKLVEKVCDSGIEFFTFASMYSFCRNCQRWFLGVVPTCMSCGSNNLQQMGRSSAVVTPVSVWPNAKTRTLDRLAHYSFP